MNIGRKLEISTTVYIIMYVEFIDEENCDLEERHGWHPRLVPEMGRFRKRNTGVREGEEGPVGMSRENSASEMKLEGV